MPNKISGIFSLDQSNRLKKFIEYELDNRELYFWDQEKFPNFPLDHYKTKIIQNPFLGKIQVTLNQVMHLIDEDIINRIASIIKESDPDMDLVGITYIEYNKKYGNPNLEKHKDPMPGILFVDYQLECNTPWDIEIEDQSFSLNDNEAVIFYPAETYHARPQKIFSSEEYVKIILFSGTVKTGSNNKKVEQ